MKSKRKKATAAAQKAALWEKVILEARASSLGIQEYLRLKKISKNTYEPDKPVRCHQGPFDRQTKIVAELAGIETGAYSKDPASTYTDPATGERLAVYYWRP
jgi:hypothetical protein